MQNNESDNGRLNGDASHNRSQSSPAALSKHAPLSPAEPSPPPGGKVRPLLPMRSKPVASHDGDASRHAPRLLILSVVLMTLVLSALMAFPILPSQVEIQEGMPASKDILSPGYLSYVSDVLTKRASKLAESDPANEVWVQDSALVQSQRSKLLNVLTIIDSVRQGETLDANAKRQRLSTLPSNIKLNDTQKSTLLSASDAEYKYWRDSGVIPAFDAVMNKQRLTSDLELNAARTALQDQLVPSLSSEERDAAVAVISPLLAVNVTLDAEQTAARRAAAAKVKPVLQTVQKGEAILRAGELATPEAIEKLQQAGLLSRTISPQNVAGITGLILVLMLLLHLYIYRYVPQVWRRPRQLLLADMLIVFTVAVAVLFLPGHNTLPYLLPVAAATMLVAVLLNTNLAVVVAFLLSLMLGLGLTSGVSLDLPIYYFISSLTGIFTLTRVERVSTFARSGLYISVVSFFTVLMLRILSNSVIDWSIVGTLALAAAFNGVMSASLTYATFSMLGTLFGITTPVQLMELAHPDQPLLRRLMREAPGTYHHSLLVSNLAEHAAEMIGADSLLTRVCAYYHDIGKVERPYYFIDNQRGMANVHDSLSPWDSARIIAQHVIDGVALGQQNKLPRRVLDAIPQHHGTMLIKYFYYKALEIDPNANPDDFRYLGPRPQTKENAILMLADGVEATVRSMAQSGALDKQVIPNNDASESPSLYNNTATLPDDIIASVVHKTISERIEDGQLDECDLTVRDIARIQEAFVGMLKGIYHPRVVYPQQPEPAGAAPEPLPVGRASGTVSTVKKSVRKLRNRSLEGKHEPQSPRARVS